MCSLYPVGLTMHHQLAPELPKLLIRSHDPRTNTNILFVCKMCFYNKGPTFDPHCHDNPSSTPVAFLWRQAIALEMLTSHISGESLRTVSGCGILLILACNLISMPGIHSRTDCFVVVFFLFLDMLFFYLHVLCNCLCIITCPYWTLNNLRIDGQS